MTVVNEFGIEQMIKQFGTDPFSPWKQLGFSLYCLSDLHALSKVAEQFGLQS